ncbi:MAG TPA: hypothetical protein VF590_15920 [Isosphaeraceae bacterium]
MKVYLLTMDSGRRLFYAEGVDAPEADGDATSPRTGLRGWLDRMSRRWHEAGQGPQEGVGRRLRLAWHWLHRRLAPDEALLKHLGRAPRIDLYHPGTLAEPEAARLWRQYLARRRLRHAIWLVVCLLLSLLSVLLMVIPGPNVLGYWFVYRAVCHLRVVIGVRRGLGNQVPTLLHPTTALDPAAELTEIQWLARVARHYRLRGLGEFLARAAPERTDLARSGRVAVALASAPDGPAGRPRPEPCPTHPPGPDG